MRNRLNYKSLKCETRITRGLPIISSTLFDASVDSTKQLILKSLAQTVTQSKRGQLDLYTPALTQADGESNLAQTVPPRLAGFFPSNRPQPEGFLRSTFTPRFKYSANIGRYADLLQVHLCLVDYPTWISARFLSPTHYHVYDTDYWLESDWITYWAFKRVHQGYVTWTTAYFWSTVTGALK
jgi:hypothetical protein